MTVPAPRPDVFAFFASARNLERITPPDLRFRIVREPAAITEGSLIDYRLRLDGVPFGWRTLISQWRPPVSFVDEQLSGPYARWVHAHHFSDHEGGTCIKDQVELELPLRPFGEIAWPYVRRKVRRIFEFRQRTVAEAFGAEFGDCASTVEIDP